MRGSFLGGWGFFAVALAQVTARAQAPTVDPTELRIEALRIERRALQDELRSLLSDDSKLTDAPAGGVLLGLPTTLVESVVSEALTGPLKNVRLSLKDVVKVRRSDVIRAKTFLGLMTLGRYALTVNVQEVKAMLKPRAPKLTFGSNRISIDLPVSVEAGDVKANLVFAWDGQKIAGALCGDLSGEHDLRATVPPVQIRLKGRFDVEPKGERLLVRPVIAPVEIAFKIEPPQQTWDFVDDLIESRNAVCQAALRKAAVGQKVRDLVAQGFKARLPTNWLHSMTLPVSFRDTVAVKGTSAGLTLTPTGVSITKTRIWYGANLVVKKQPAPARRAAS